MTVLFAAFVFVFQDWESSVVETFSTPELSLPATEPQAPDQSSFRVVAPSQEENADGRTLIRAGKWISSEHAMDYLKCMMACQTQSSTGDQAYRV